MNYRNRNTLNAILAFIGFNIAFYFFFLGMKFGPLLAIVISSFLTVTMFFTPAKIEKVKKKQKEYDEIQKKAQLSPKEISDNDIDNLDLNNIEGFEDNK